jgi:hypothetical protein
MDIIQILAKWGETNRLIRWLFMFGCTEGCHLLAAYVAGVKVIQTSSTSVDVEEGKPWQMRIIILAPTKLGIAGTIGFVFFSSSAFTHISEIINEIWSLLMSRGWQAVRVIYRSLGACWHWRKQGTGKKKL